MRKPTATILFVLVVLLAFTGFRPIPARAGRIDPDLEGRLLKASPDAFLPVMIRATGTVTGAALKRRLGVQYRMRKDRHRAALETLQLAARTAQAPILQVLSQPSFAGRVAKTKSFWIDNVITAEMTPTAISELANHADVDEILYLPPVEFFKSSGTVETASPADALGSATGGLRAIKADVLWKMGYTGKGRLVATIDTGVDGDHIFLADKWRGNNGYTVRESWFNPQTADEKPRVFADDPHGTEVMGILVAIQDQAVPGDNTLDTLGVAFDAQWISAAVIDIAGSNILEAMQWIVDPDGDPNTELDVPDVVGNPWGAFPADQGCSDVFWNAIDNVEAAGAAMIFAAGNEGQSGPLSIRNPANRATSETNAFAVGMINDEEPSFPLDPRSSLGPSLCDGTSIKPEVVAPGVNIQTTFHSNLIAQNVDGTSYAVPHVAGGIALLREYNPNATVEEIKTALLNSALDLGNPGPDNSYGHGLIDLEAALALMPPNDQPSLYIKHDYYTRPAPGSTTEMVIVLRSAGTPVSNVAVTVASQHPQLSVVSGSATFGDFAAMGDTAGNFSTPFVFDVDTSAVEGERLPMRFEISGSDGYSRVVQGVIQVGPERTVEVFTHDAGQFRMTISAFGQFGLQPGSLAPRAGGEGYLYGDDPTETLFEGAFVVGIDAVHVSDNARDRLSFPDFDFQVDPGGRLEISEPGKCFPEETHAAFSDEIAEAPIGLFIEQRTFVDSTANTDDFLVAEYTIHNRSGAEITGLRAGLYFDWDFPWESGERDGGGFDAEAGVGWMRDRGLEIYRGLAVLTPTGATSYRYFMNDPEIYDGFENSEKWQALSEGFVTTTPPNVGDASQLIATGPFTVPSDGSVTVAFAIIGATSEEDILAAAEAAATRYGQGVALDKDAITMATKELGVDPGEEDAEVVVIENLNSRDIAWQVTSAPTWVVTEPSEGTIPGCDQGSLRLLASSAGLSEGVYDGTVTITAQQQGQEPQDLTLDFDFEVTTKRLVVLTDSLYFEAPVGGSDPPSQFIELDNPHPVPPIALLEHEPIWATAQILEGVSENDLRIEVAASLTGLTDSTYRDSLLLSYTIDSTGTVSEKVPLTFNVTAVEVSPELLAFQAEVDETVFEPCTLSVFNGTTEIISVELAHLPDWLKVDDGDLEEQVLPGNSWEIEVRPVNIGLPVGSYADSIMVETDVTGKPPLKVPVTLTLTFSSADIRPWDSPFNPAEGPGKICFTVPEAGGALMDIYDITGEKVRVIAESLQPGFQCVKWDGTTDGGVKAASGVYLCRLVYTATDGSPTFQETLKLVLKR